ncbi:MAG: hypothetical protein M1363_06505 [Gammaproteobacteria bacterium]|nr:hypothetical protein [Gammaproteobacteria bacterium]
MSAAEQLEQLYQQKKYQAIVTMAEDLLADASLSITGQIRIADAYYALKDYPAAIDVYRQVVRVGRLEKLPHTVFSRSRVAVARTYKERKVIERVFATFSSDLDNEFAHSLQTLIDKDLDVALADFQHAIAQVFSEDALRTTWFDAFATMAKAYCGETDAVTFVPYEQTLDKVIVSGMGWSGSGALYDFLQEFPEVVAIKGESPYIEGHRSLMSVAAGFEQGTENDKLLEFFFYVLLGFAEMRSSNDAKSFRYARRLHSGARRQDYAQIALFFAQNSASIMLEKDVQQKQVKFRQLANYVTDKLAVGKALKPGQVALLDNVIHIANLHCVDFLDNVRVLCTFRDPRSNYVALLREAGHFNDSASVFVRKNTGKFRRAHALVDSYTEKYPFPQRKAVAKVCFESFILLPEFRQRLATDLQLDVQQQNKFTYLKPWESARNVFLHQEHEPQSDIDYIAEKLADFCVDIEVKLNGRSCS